MQVVISLAFVMPKKQDTRQCDLDIGQDFFTVRGRNPALTGWSK